MPDPESICWKGRDAARLVNGVVELIAVTGGGHLAGFRFLEQNGAPSQNVFWEAPWDTSDPTNGCFEKLSMAYGPPEIGKFLAGFTGHALVLDYFGLPSVDEAAAGLALHGEAAAMRWNVATPTDMKGAACQWNVELPASRLMFERKIQLGEHESVAFVEESGRNERETDHIFHWVQHATFGPPFLMAGESTFAASARRGITSPTGYEEHSLVANGRDFSWPYIPREDADAVDLMRPFSTKGRGFLATVQLDPQRKVEYLLAMNWKLRLGVGYCFRREDFPWMAIWEENCVRQNIPWSGESQVRGMEFGTTPLPLGREATLRRGPLFDTPTWGMIPAHGIKTARYLIFLFTIPAEMNSVQSAEVEDNAIILYGTDAHLSLSIPAYGCGEFISTDKK